MNKINLLNFTKESLSVVLPDKSFRAKQIIKWIHQHSVTEFSNMTNISNELKKWLHENTEIKLPKIAKEQISIDGTRKWLIELEDSKYIEMVFIPYFSETDEKDLSRGTLCISSQVGCALKCSFCATATQGFYRNLNVAEIISQVFLAKRIICDNSHSISNIVLMGMGEPLLNFSNVVDAIDLMLDDDAYGLSKYRVTLSTSGIVPGIYELKKQSPISLAVSLHAPNNELRNELMPINKKYPLEVLIPACQKYFENDRRKVTFEYAMINSVNDKNLHAEQLIRLLETTNCKINLIPFNPFFGCLYKKSSDENIEKFKNKLKSAGFNVIVRKTRGQDILASCGQLVAKK